MRILALTIALILSPMAGLLNAGDPQPPARPSPVAVAAVAAVPDLADIVPLAAQLSVRLAVLEKQLNEGLVIASADNMLDLVDMNLEGPADQLARLKSEKNYKHQQIVTLKEAIGDQQRLLVEINGPLREYIRRLGGWRKEWLTERKQWRYWQAALGQEFQIDHLQSTFQRTNAVVDTALGLVLPQLEAMLIVQEKAANVQTRIGDLSAACDALLKDKRRDSLLTASPPIMSAEFISQIQSAALWRAVGESTDDIVWPGSRFLNRQGWPLLAQGFIAIFSIVVVYQNRQRLKASERWRFLAARPISAGLLFGFMATLEIYEYGGAPPIWKLANTIIAAAAFARLMGALITVSWQKQFVYGLMTVLIASRLMDGLNFPLPILRLYTFFAALAGLAYCWRLAGESTRDGQSPLYALSLRLVAFFFTVIIIAELWGKKALGSHIFFSLIRSMATVLVFALFMHLIRGGLEWLFRTSPLRRASAITNHETEVIIGRLAWFVNIVVMGLFLLPAVLMFWGVYDSLGEAAAGLLSLGFNLGDKRISVSSLLAAAAILYGSFLTSWMVHKLLVEKMRYKRIIEKGVRLSIARLAHYFIMLVGLMIALSSLGLEIGKITLMLSALSVGIGFGLQTVVNNFISGLILLFERPVRVGDYIEFNGTWAEIKEIGLRATIVQTFDSADVIIPNADLVTNQVTNWTLSNRLVRVIVPVGVAYGSDISLVTETLMACAKANPHVTNYPSPQVLFLNFGESSLDFELRAWVKDADERVTVNSELHYLIDQRFRAAKIEISFPQRDLHVRSVDAHVNIPARKEEAEPA